MDIADVSTDTEAEGTWDTDLERAGMFSHNSSGLWDHAGDGVTSEGYEQRDHDDGETHPYGYTAAQGRFNNPWDSLVELLEEHCPFIANIDNNCEKQGGGHYVTVIGYEIDDEDKKWVCWSDPADSDGEWVRKSMVEWGTLDPEECHFLRKWDFRDYSALVMRPMPVDLELVLDDEALNEGEFMIRATVRTCHEFPDAEGVDRHWYVDEEDEMHVNRNRELKGDEFGAENLPITITYGGATKVGGADTQPWNPGQLDDATVKEWIFAADGNEKGVELKVVVTGWAIEYDAENYNAVSDELFGWGVIRIDESFSFLIKDSTGDTVAAIGDQGNLYLSGTLSQWYDGEFVEGSVLIRNGSTGDVVALFDDSGNLFVE